VRSLLVLVLAATPAPVGCAQAKSLKITESEGVALGAQVFSLTNTGSFASLNTNENLPAGGQVTATQDQPRLFEFGLKFVF